MPPHGAGRDRACARALELPAFIINFMQNVLHLRRARAARTGDNEP